MKDETTPTGQVRPDAVGQQAVAHRLGVSRHTVIRLERDGRLPRLPGGGRPRYAEADVAVLERERATRRTPQQLRGQLLEAAAGITAVRGPAACTIQAVADEAGVTTGAVLHHFPHKTDLLAGLVEEFAMRFERQWSRLRQRPGSTVAGAYVAASTVTHHPLAAALLACAAHDLALLSPLRARVESWYRDIAAEGPAAVRSCLAADAVWLYALFGMAPVADVEAVVEGAGSS